jgi:hypothetical protein
VIRFGIFRVDKLNYEKKRICRSMVIVFVILNCCTAEEDTSIVFIEMMTVCSSKNVLKFVLIQTKTVLVICQVFMYRINGL